jgi:predicted amidohydrolase
VYVISDEGQIVDRYDKRFCTGAAEPEPAQDLAHYSPGNRPCVFEVDGYRCGVLICYDYRFPELYRELKRLGVEVLLQSFHNARRDRDTHENHNIWKDIVPATMMCHAATNYFWISATNSAARFSSWPTFFVEPDGMIAGRLPLHEPGVLVSQVDPAAGHWDAPGPWRDRAMSGRLHSGETVADPRSADHRCF